MIKEFFYVGFTAESPQSPMWDDWDCAWNWRKANRAEGMKIFSVEVFIPLESVLDATARV